MKLNWGGKKGFTLLEVMIALLILEIGLLGLASMQTQALQAIGMGGNMAVANTMARDVSERIMKNAKNVGSYDLMNTSTVAKPNCPNLTPAPVCAQDFSDWQNSITNLPQGVLIITSAVGATFNTVTVSVSWLDSFGSHSVNVPLQVAP